MKTKSQNPTIIPILVFVGLAIVFAVLLFAASGLQNAFTQTTLVSLGSAIFGAGLVFFPLRLTGWE
jgi:Na+/phosphate symporter